MKKSTIIVLLLFSVAPVMAQQWKMHVVDSNGAELSYDIDSIAAITFTPITTPRYLTAYIFGRIPSMLYGGYPGFEEFYLDSMTFGKDTGGQEALFVQQVQENGGSFSFYLDSIPSIHVDSIIFAIYEKDTNLIELPWTYSDGGFTEYGNYFSSVWNGNRVYCSEPSRYFVLDSNLNITADNFIGPTDSSGYAIGNFTLAVTPDGNRILSVSTDNIGPNFDGFLLEYNLTTGASTDLVPTDSNISSAVYFSGTDSIVYYSYGSYDTSIDPPDAGYYFLDRATGKRTLLLHYISDMGPREVINGFDVSPDGKKLLIPSVSYKRKPLVIEYDLTTQQSDTLNITFDDYPLGLWLRYSHDGTKILYSYYPLEALSDEEIGGVNQVGIIDRATFAKQILIAAPDNEPTWVTVFPQWSPDDSKIIFGCGQYSFEPPGVADYQLYILKSLQ